MDAHRDEKRFIVRAYEKLTAFLELETVIRKLAGFVSREIGGKTRARSNARSIGFTMWLDAALETQLALRARRRSGTNPW